MSLTHKIFTWKLTIAAFRCSPVNLVTFCHWSQDKTHAFSQQVSKKTTQKTASVLIFVLSDPFQLKENWKAKLKASGTETGKNYCRTLQIARFVMCLIWKSSSAVFSLSALVEEGSHRDVPQTVVHMEGGTSAEGLGFVIQQRQTEAWGAENMVSHFWYLS